MQMYFGDVSLCYTYSLTMALHSYGYDVRPEFLEAIMVMGNGASIVKEDEETLKRQSAKRLNTLIILS